MNKYAIILAAGDGKRLGLNIPKCFTKINGRFIFEYSMQIFWSIPVIKKIFLVVPKGYEKKFIFNDPRIQTVVGGKNRNESFENAVKQIKNYRLSDKIIVHDAARMFVTKYDVLKIVNSKEDFGTLCYVGEKNKTDFRIKQYNIQTPQFCRFSVYKSVKTPNKKGKDLFSYLKLKPLPKNSYLTSNAERNFKITFKADLAKAKKCLK